LLLIRVGACPHHMYTMSMFAGPRKKIWRTLEKRGVTRDPHVTLQDGSKTIDIVRGTVEIGTEGFGAFPAVHGHAAWLCFCCASALAGPGRTLVFAQGSCAMVVCPHPLIRDAVLLHRRDAHRRRKPISGLSHGLRRQRAKPV